MKISLLIIFLFNNIIINNHNSAIGPKKEPMVSTKDKNPILLKTDPKTANIIPKKSITKPALFALVLLGKKFIIEFCDGI